MPFLGRGFQAYTSMFFASWVLTSCETTTQAVSAAQKAPAPSIAVPQTVERPAQAPRPANRAGGPLTLDAVVAAAIEVHPSIQVAQSQVLAATAGIDVARAAYYPSISAGMGTGDAGSSSGIRWRPQMQLSVSQMVYDFGKTDASVRSRIARREASDVELIAARESVARDTIEAYSEVQRYSAMDQVAQAQADGIGKIAALVADRSQSGASSRSDEQQAIARVQAAKTNRLEINSQLQRWRAVLGQYIGRAVPAQLASKSSVIDRGCDGTDLRIDRASSVLVAEAKQREAGAELAREKSNAYPTIALDGGASYAFAGHVDNGDRTFYRLGLNVKTDVFNGGASKAALAAASFAADGAMAGVQLARFEVNNAVTTAKSQVGNVREMIKLLNERDGVLQETRDLYRDQYVELGTRTLLDLLNAEQDVHQAAFDKINSTFDLRKLGLVCLYSSGALREKFNIGDIALPVPIAEQRPKVAQL